MGGGGLVCWRGRQAIKQRCSACRNLLRPLLPLLTLGGTTGRPCTSARRHRAPSGLRAPRSGTSASMERTGKRWAVGRHVDLPCRPWAACWPSHRPPLAGVTPTVCASQPPNPPPLCPTTRRCPTHHRVAGQVAGTRIAGVAGLAHLPAAGAEGDAGEGVVGGRCAACLCAAAGRGGKGRGEEMVCCCGCRLANAGMQSTSDTPQGTINQSMYSYHPWHLCPTAHLGAS